MTVHIIPDIHGRIDKLQAALGALGFSHTRGAWRHPYGDTVMFLGDFIDRGPENGAVIDLVRDMIEAGTARAVMGNHELNAIHYHTDDPMTGDGLRPRSARNQAQHEAFLAEFPLGAARTKHVINWMQSLPIIVEDKDFRAVHACWDKVSVERLLEVQPDAILVGDLVYRSADDADPLMTAVERLTKGPELALPLGCGVHDQEGVRRERVRVRWWQSGAQTWRDISMSVFNPDELPTQDLPDGLAQNCYGPTEKPVFFGHYWLDGAPRMQAPNALCLDYSAGLNGPLVTYRMTSGVAGLDLSNLVVHTSTKDM
jgi:hypothetical protein